MNTLYVNIGQLYPRADFAGALINLNMNNKTKHIRFWFYEATSALKDLVSFSVIDTKIASQSGKAV